MQQRIQKNPFLELFDGSDGNLPLADRHESITGPQALYFINSPFLHEQSRAIARRMIASGSGIQDAYALIFGRLALQEEVARGEEFLARLESDLGQTTQEAWAGYLRGMLGSNEFMFID